MMPLLLWIARILSVIVASRCLTTRSSFPPANGPGYQYSQYNDRNYTDSNANNPSCRESARGAWGDRDREALISSEISPVLHVVKNG